MLAERELAYEECKVKVHDNMQVNDRLCSCIEVRHLRFESYDWPKEGSDVPVLLEEYAYRDLRLNFGLTDEDFQRSNREYGFR